MIFQEKNVVIIGGTKGTGLKIAELLSERGANVFAFGRTIPDFDYKDKIKFIHCDFSEASFYDNYEKQLKSYLNKSDILIIPFGPFCYKSIEETSFDDWKEMTFCNLALPGFLISSIIPHYIEKKGGKIILFGGTRTESIRVCRKNTAYGSAKTGLSVLIKSVAAEYDKFGIYCNGILPGFTHSEPKGAKTVSELTLAQQVLYLLENDSLNGVLLNVDNGWSF